LDPFLYFFGDYIWYLRTVNNAEYEKINDVALFIRKYHKGLKKQGYKVVPRRFSNKKKRMCYGCGSTKHLIASCPLENKESNHKHSKKEGKYESKKNYKRSGEAHIGHEWD